MKKSRTEQFLRDVGTPEDPCWVPCSKGDPGAVLFISANSAPAALTQSPTQKIVDITRKCLEWMEQSSMSKLDRRQVSKFLGELDRAEQPNPQPVFDVTKVRKEIDAAMSRAYDGGNDFGEWNIVQPIINALTRARAILDAQPIHIGVDVARGEDRLAGVICDSEKMMPVPEWLVRYMMVNLHRTEAPQPAAKPLGGAKFKCDQCGGPHILDCVIPSEAWNKIAGTEEMLCITCIDARLKENGLSAEGRFYYPGDALKSELYADEMEPLSDSEILEMVGKHWAKHEIDAPVFIAFARAIEARCTVSDMTLPVVPEGYRIVPWMPTIEMLNAFRPGQSSMANYQAMVQAAEAAIKKITETKEG